MSITQNKWSISLCIFLSGFIIMGCAPEKPASENSYEVSDQNYVRAGDPSLVRTIGDQSHQYVVMARQAFESRIVSGEIEKTSDMKMELNSDDENTDGHKNSQLIFGLPMDQLNQPMMFGAVITKVSNAVSEDLGNLKLSDIPTFDVIIKQVKKKNKSSSILILACEGNCKAVTKKSTIIKMPVLGVDQRKKVLFINLSSLGKELDLRTLHGSDPVFEQFQSISSKTVAFDYSQSTLVFDVEARLREQGSSRTDQDTFVTNRWFLRNASDLNPKFVSRKAAKGVGYFMTERKSSNYIQRWDFDQRSDDAGIKYYLKNVPEEYQAIFAGAFEGWNSELLPVIGKRVLSYEFISEKDPRNELLVTGDVRYNVMEWDLVNKASYGGLGPSLANPATGEIFQASVLVQGPTIIDLYSKWFQASQKAQELRGSGKMNEAERTLAQTNQTLLKQIAPRSQRTFEMTFAKNHSYRIHSQMEVLADPLMSRLGFDEVPEGYDFPRYMAGYFHDMLEHELGHNLGLRHNFKGNLGAEGASEVSRSVMEYLGRNYRYLDHIGPYDIMAIKYGYTGIAPDHTDWFCTDEDVASIQDPTKSAECSKDDATEDPFGYYQNRLLRAIELLTAAGTPQEPEWTVEDMSDTLVTIFQGLGTYAVSAQATGDSWTNFFNQPHRPTRATEVKSYVLATLKEMLCRSEFQIQALTKATRRASAKTKSNLNDLRTKAAEVLQPVFSQNELSCRS